ncbi:MAG: hypothetical protein IJO28_02085, partial [Oscillospiraceae bacterium]|nr:hypothetical protein [Oscillospiraceae bacterium]
RPHSLAQHQIDCAELKLFGICFSFAFGHLYLSFLSFFELSKIIIPHSAARNDTALGFFNFVQRFCNAQHCAARRAAIRYSQQFDKLKCDGLRSLDKTKK